MTTMIAGLSGCKEQDGVSLQYEKYTLDNGLEVVLHEDHSDPTVSMAIAYHVGSSREKPGKTGFAHFFEHMLFQRSENLPRNAFFQKINEMGGTFNGWTANDMTVYFESVPRNALEKILWMESDRMGYFINTVTEGGLKREIDVVSNEKRQYENAPYGLMSELLDKNLFPEGHPYSWEVIGEIPDLRSATVEDVKEFYNKYYTPSNATLVIAGDFDKAQTKELVQKYLGSVVPYTDNFFACLNSAVFSDGSFVFIPKGVKSPMELSSYFRINARNSGQFERTLIVCEEGAYVSYLEGCTAPQRDENQLHAAVVEIVVLDDAEVKYSTVQNWYPGDKDGKGGIYNFVTKRGLCRNRAKLSWTQVETGSAITWKYPSCVLAGDDSVGEFYSVALTNHYQQADTGTKMIHLGRNTRSTIVSKGISYILLFFLIFRFNGSDGRTGRAGSKWAE